MYGHYIRRWFPGDIISSFCLLRLIVHSFSLHILEAEHGELTGGLRYFWFYIGPVRDIRVWRLVSPSCCFVWVHVLLLSTYEIRDEILRRVPRFAGWGGKSTLLLRGCTTTSCSTTWSWATNPALLYDSPHFKPCGLALRLFTLGVHYFIDGPLAPWSAYSHLIAGRVDDF